MYHVLSCVNITILRVKSVFQWNTNYFIVVVSLQQQEAVNNRFTFYVVSCRVVTIHKINKCKTECVFAGFSFIHFEEEQGIQFEHAACIVYKTRAIFQYIYCQGVYHKTYSISLFCYRKNLANKIAIMVKTHNYFW